MALSVDNCTSISTNCSNNTLMKTAYHDPLCFYGTHIMMVVIVFIILPINIWSLWLIKKATTTQRGTAFSDLLHFNLIFTSVIFCIGLFLNSLYIIYIPNSYLYSIKAYIWTLSLMAQAQFHTWICVEQYMAVVHPIFYLKLKQFQYKIVWVSFTWVTSHAFGGLYVFIQKEIARILFIIPFSGLIVLILFCGVVTLAKLKKPNPGEGERRKMHHQKITAFRNITLSLMVLLISYFPYICLTILWEHLHPKVLCIARSIVSAFLLPGVVFQSVVYILRPFRT